MKENTRLNWIVILALVIMVGGTIFIHYGIQKFKKEPIAYTGSVTIQWDPSPGSDFYRLYWYYDGQTTEPSYVESHTTSATVRELRQGQTYTFFALGITADGVASDPSKPIRYTVPRIAPTAARLTAPATNVVTPNFSKGPFRTNRASNLRLGVE